MTSKKKKNNNSNVALLAGICAVFIIVIIIIIITSPDEKTRGSEYAQYAQTINNRLNILLDDQKVVDNELREIIKSDEYTLQDPYVKVDPYGISPLSAIVIFKTKEVEAINVYINDEFFSQFEASKTHVIPLYGLFNNSKVYVRLELDDGQANEFTINTTVLNESLDSFDLKKNIGNHKNYFLVGSLNTGASVIRGFDEYGILVSYINLNYISGYKLRNEHFYVQYNQKNTYGTDLPNIKLELDYLGKIYNVSEDTSELTTEHNINLKDTYYIGYQYDLYKTKMDNYEIKDVILENNIVMKPSKTYTSLLDESLSAAVDYEGKLSIIPNGNTITIATNEENVKALLVELNGSETYVFNVDENIIRTNLRGKYIVFLQVDSIIYRTDIVLSL